MLLQSLFSGEIHSSLCMGSFRILLQEVRSGVRLHGMGSGCWAKPLQPLAPSTCVKEGGIPFQSLKADLQYSLLITPLSRTEKLNVPGCFARLTL